MIDILKEAHQNCCITFDCWTNSHRHICYITFTYHYINASWKLVSTVLKTTFFEAPHTAVRIRDVFKELLSEYGLTDKKVCCVTDGGGNMKLACTYLNVKRLACVAHQINRLITYDLLQKNRKRVQPICDLIEKLRKIQRSLIYKYGELSKIYKKDRNDSIFTLLEQLETMDQEWTASENFIDIDEDIDNGAFNGMKAFSIVRWSCIYSLVKCHRDYISTIKKCLEDNYKHDLVLNLTEVKLLDKVTQLLECFHNITKYIQGNMYPTQNVLPLIYSEAKRHLNEILSNEKVWSNDDICSNEESVIVVAAKILLENLESRMELTPVSIVAAIVDPSLQHLPIIDQWLQKKSIKVLDHRLFLLRNNNLLFFVHRSHTSIDCSPGLQRDGNMY